MDPYPDAAAQTRREARGWLQLERDQARYREQVEPLDLDQELRLRTIERDQALELQGLQQRQRQERQGQRRSERGAQTGAAFRGRDDALEARHRRARERQRLRIRMQQQGLPFRRPPSATR